MAIKTRHTTIKMRSMEMIVTSRSGAVDRSNAESGLTTCPVCERPLADPVCHWTTETRKEIQKQNKEIGEKK